MLLPQKIEHSASKKYIYHAFTLLELLVALSIGSSLLLIAGQMYSVFIFQHARQQELLQLQKISHQITAYLQQQILHIGYQGKNREKSNFEWFKSQGKPYYLSEQCLILLQDFDKNGSDGCLGERVKKQCSENDISIARNVQQNIFAIKLEQKQLWGLGRNSFTPCYKNECQKWLENCRNLNWQRISANPDHRVDTLHFSWEKENKLIKIELSLSSLKYPNIHYTSTTYAYILNGV